MVINSSKIWMIVPDQNMSVQSISMAVLTDHCISKVVGLCSVQYEDQCCCTK